MPASLRVLIVAEDATARFGGEAVLPLHYFRFLRRRGVEAWLITHARSRDELVKLLPQELDRVHFIPDTWIHRSLYAVGRRLPARLHYVTLGFLMRLWTQWLARRKAAELIARHEIDVVHQPTPVSPKEPSLIVGLGVPVLIGPMNGGMNYPPAFRQFEGRSTRWITAIGRRGSAFFNWLIPGKRRAAALLVANERTRRALPPGLPRRGEVITLVENGVDLTLWENAASRSDRAPDQPVRFVFLGRLVDWKCVDLLIAAFAKLNTARPCTLEILGDGPMRGAWERLAAALGVADRVAFRGWLPQVECADRLREADALVLPSIYECGGAVVLEAMACGLPVIATDWGGPADYLDASCGFLIEPASRESMIDEISSAMATIAESPERAAALGRAGRARVEQEFDWERKIDRILEVYASVLGRPAPAPVGDPAARLGAVG